MKACIACKYNLGCIALHLPGEFGGVVATEAQHFLQVLQSGRDQRDRLLLLALLHISQMTYELCLSGVNQTWSTEEEKVSLKSKRQQNC